MLHLVSSAVAAGNINQGTNNNVVYVTQMSSATEPVAVNSIQFTLNGTIDANDLTLISIYFNATAPTIAGSFLLNNTSGAFTSGHSYNIPFSNSMTAGSTGYYIIAVNVAAAATDNHTIKIDGAADPIVFGFTTSPNIIDNQTDAAGAQTIQAADIALNTSTVATNTFVPGSNSNIVYVVQMPVATEPVVVNNIQFTLNGTFDANDLTLVSIYYNATAPTIAGSFLLNNASAAFASGHPYSIAFSNIAAIGSAGYYIIAVNVSATATIGNTVLINGATDPVVFGFTTAPNVTNSQADAGGLHTLPLNFISIKASEKNGSVQVEWVVASEINIDHYDVERSSDGRAFNSIGKIAATGGASNISYNLLDVSPAPGINFYRITAINKDGRIQYSPVVRINTDGGKKGFSVYPNPVMKNGPVQLQLENLEKDSYVLTMFNTRGQLIIKQIIEHNGGNSVQIISLKNAVAGMYTIVLRNQKIQFVKKIIIE